MASLSLLRDELLLLLDDDSFGADRLDYYINQALLQVADEAGIILPALKTMTSVTSVVGQATIALPADFSGKLLSFGDPSRVRIFSSLERLFEYYHVDGYLPITEGDVEAVAVEHDVIWIQKVPATATTFSMIYRRNPPLLQSDADVPSCLPESVQRDLLVYGAARIAFDTIEDGIEGAKVNTQSCDYRYNQGLMRLRVILGNNRAHINRSAWRA